MKRVIVSPEAEAHVRVIGSWWETNRPLAVWSAVRDRGPDLRGLWRLAVSRAITPQEDVERGANGRRRGAPRAAIRSPPP